MPKSLRHCSKSHLESLNKQMKSSPVPFINAVALTILSLSTLLLSRCNQFQTFYISLHLWLHYTLHAKNQIHGNKCKLLSAKHLSFLNGSTMLGSLSVLPTAGMTCLSPIILWRISKQERGMNRAWTQTCKNWVPFLSQAGKNGSRQLGGADQILQTMFSIWAGDAVYTNRFLLFSSVQFSSLVLYI